MAIEKRFIHFKKFSDFNSKKLSANEANTQYTIGISGEIQNGSPDVLYQSYVWIKDTQQQWTHGQIYNGSASLGNETDPIFSASPAANITEDQITKWTIAVQTYVVPFDILQLLRGETISGVHFHELETAINEHKLILIPVDAGSPVFGYLPMSAWVEGDIYFSVLFDDTIIYGEIAVNSEEIYTSDIKIIKPELKQDALVSGENIKTINGESILGNGNIEISSGIDSEVYITDFTMGQLRQGMDNGNQVTCDMQALITAMNANKIILVRENADSFYKGVYVLNGYIEDLLYFSIVETGGSILWCEGTDYTSSSYINGQSLHVRDWNKKQDTITDLEDIREGASKGSTALQTYIVDFDILELQSGEDILNIRTDLLIEAIETHKLILIPFSKEDPLMGYLPVTAYYEDYVYLGISNGATHIDANIRLDNNKIYANDISIFNLYEKQDKLISGENIKTINGESILGSGRMNIITPYLIEEFTLEDLWNLWVTGVHSTQYSEVSYIVDAIEHGRPICIQSGYSGYTDNIVAISSVQDDLIYVTFIDAYIDKFFVLSIDYDSHSVEFDIRDFSISNLSQLNSVAKKGTFGIEIPSGKIETDGHTYALPNSEDGDEYDVIATRGTLKTINGQSIMGTGDIEIDANIQAVDTQETLDDVNTNNYVKYVAQTLSYYDKEQARKNIGVYNGKEPLLIEGTNITFVKETPMFSRYWYVAANALTSLSIEYFYHSGLNQEEYSISFLTGSSCTVSLPSDTYWANGTVPEIEGNTLYELSVTRTGTTRGVNYFKAVLVPFKLV